ncbi:hypothetical protein C8J36_11125 [Rhizobium sp. PP-F2F-G48]|nr:hypothetical protein C8J36_11125 [Rhizobium sp. PP-F2F-G48]
MSRAKGGFTVELKRPKRHLLNRSAMPKASWMESNIHGTEPRADPGTRPGASSDHDARAMAERLFAPRTAGQARILPELSPMAAVSQTSDAPHEPVEPQLPEEKDVSHTTAAIAEKDGPFVANDAALEVREDAVSVSETPEPGKRQKTRRAPAVDLPPGKRWMRLLPSVLQERAVPRWKRMRSARLASREGQRTDQTSDESR